MIPSPYAVKYVDISLGDSLPGILCWTSHPLSKGLHHINLWKLSLGSSVCRLCSKSPLPAHYRLLPFWDFVSITNWKQTFSDISVTRQIEISKHQVGSLQPLTETGGGSIAHQLHLRHCTKVLTEKRLCLHSRGLSLMAERTMGEQGSSRRLREERKRSLESSWLCPSASLIASQPWLRRESTQMQGPGVDPPRLRARLSLSVSWRCLHSHTQRCASPSPSCANLVTMTVMITHHA